MAGSNQLTIWKGSDTLLEVGTTDKPFRNADTGVALTGASVSALIHAKDDDAQLGATLGSWTETPASSGIYHATIADDHADLVIGQEVVVKITANGGAGLLAYWEIEGIVAPRKK